MENPRRAYQARWRQENAEHLREQKAAYHQRQREADPIGYRRKRRAIRLRNVYGIDLAEVEVMLVQQDYRCAICGDERRPDGNSRKQGLVVDHDHESGRVRGLLCKRCNTLLGMANESRERLRDALAYLDRHEEA